MLDGPDDFRMHNSMIAAALASAALGGAQPAIAPPTWYVGQMDSSGLSAIGSAFRDLGRGHASIVTLTVIPESKQARHNVLFLEIEVDCARRRYRSFHLEAFSDMIYDGSFYPKSSWKPAPRGTDIARIHAYVCTEPHQPPAGWAPVSLGGKELVQLYFERLLGRGATTSDP